MQLSAANESPPAHHPNLEEEQLRGISRTVAEIHWLLLILVLLFLTFGNVETDAEPAISAGAFFYAAFVMSFRYANFFTRESRWKVAIESWAMIAFITWTLVYTGGLSSPLLNSYLLPVITSALTLGKVTTVFEVVMVAACHIWLGESIPVRSLVSLPFIGALVAQMAPVLLVAYIVTMFSSDILFGLSRAKMLSETDELTGIPNTRGFAIAASRLFGQAIRYQRPAAILMIDSDNLKAVNDTLGHPVGNRLLRLLARVIQDELRSSDVLARYGGDEFIVLLPETPPAGAALVAERIRKTMASMPLEEGHKQVLCTVSVGLASFPDDGTTLELVISRADRAMYRAKQDGRNRVVKFSDAEADPPAAQ
jgi:diguanylate cyclase (GGDEF)-like protein